MTTYTPETGERIASLLVDFKLTTMSGELVPRLLSAGHEEALLLVREVLELEAQGRLERRVDRLRRRGAARYERSASSNARRAALSTAASSPPLQ